MTRAPARLAAAVALAALAVGATAHAQPSASDPVVARVTVPTPSDVARFMALGLDVLEMREADDLFIVTTRAEVRRLRVEGWKVRIDRQQTALLERQRQERQRPQTAPSQALVAGGYRTVAEMRAFLEDRAAQHPDLAEVFVFGASWERLNGPSEGHDLVAITLTNKQRPGPKPTLFLMAAIHARELSTSELALRLVDHLLASYGIDGDATWLLDEHSIVVVPVVNPDGRVLAEAGYLQRKNTDTTYGQCTIPRIGVDLNRNSSFKWGVVNTPSQSACSETYPGPVPVSEPETAALESLVRSLFPDQRGPNDADASPPSATGVLITVHSYGNLVLWPWGWTSAPAPNAVGLARIGRKLASYNGYRPQQSIELYPTSGTTDDWAYGELGIAAFTFEIGPSGGECGGFFPPFSCLDGGAGGAFWSKNAPAFLYAARIARTPFLLAEGPTAESATAASLADGRVELQVRLDEADNGGQSIAAAEYYVDTPPWSGGVPTAMTALDGDFDSATEIAAAVLGPFTERRLIFVRGRDSADAWGPTRAVFTPDPACGAALSPATQSVPASGASASVTVTVADGCGWTAASVAPWITIPIGSAGVGGGSVSYDVAPNPLGAPRTATIVVGGQTLAIHQEGPPPPPDLRAAEVSYSPPAVAPGGALSVTDTTANVGAVSAPASATRYHLSASGSRDSAARLLTGNRPVPALDVGWSSTGAATVTVPSGTPLGRFYVLACADDTAKVAESDEGNNCVASAEMVDVARPDLIPTAVGDPPAAVAPGSAFLAADTVQNQGLVGAGPSTTRYYLSIDQKKGTSDKLLGGSRAVPALLAGAASDGTATVTVPTGIPLAAYYLLACADQGTGVPETDEANNCRPSTRKVSVTRPDLIETAVSDPPAEASRGSRFPVTDTVTNQGAVAASASKTRYYLSFNQTRGDGDKLLTGMRSVPGLDAGEPSEGTVVVTIPSSVPLGTYYLLACADDTALVVEITNANNCRPSATRVTVTP